MSILALPLELQQQALKYLGGRELAKGVERSCKLWKALSDDSVWREAVANDPLGSQYFSYSSLHPEKPPRDQFIQHASDMRAIAAVAEDAAKVARDNAFKIARAERRTRNRDRRRAGFVTREASPRCLLYPSRRVDWSQTFHFSPDSHGRVRSVKVIVV